MVFVGQIGSLRPECFPIRFRCHLPVLPLLVNEIVRIDETLILQIAMVIVDVPASSVLFREHHFAKADVLVRGRKMHFAHRGRLVLLEPHGEADRARDLVAVLQVTLGVTVVGGRVQAETSRMLF